MLCLLGTVLLAGCSSTPGPPDFQVAPGQYAAAFEATRDALAADRFALERVDAAAGVIATDPKTTAGLATPWDAEQLSMSQEFEDLGNLQKRRVRVTFEPVSGVAADDLRAWDGAVNAKVEVVIGRMHRTEWRLESSAIRYSTFARDPELQAREMWPQYETAFAQDPEYAGKLADQIRKRLNIQTGPAKPRKPQGPMLGEPDPWTN